MIETTAAAERDENLARAVAVHAGDPPHELAGGLGEGAHFGLATFGTPGRALVSPGTRSGGVGASGQVTDTAGGCPGRWGTLSGVIFGLFATRAPSV